MRILEKDEEKKNCRGVYGMLMQISVLHWKPTSAFIEIEYLSNIIIVVIRTVIILN
jgi:hypothetical protein